MLAVCVDWGWNDFEGEGSFVLSLLAKVLVVLGLFLPQLSQLVPGKLIVLQPDEVNTTSPIQAAEAKVQRESENRMFTRPYVCAEKGRITALRAANGIRPVPSSLRTK